MGVLESLCGKQSVLLVCKSYLEDYGDFGVLTYDRQLAVCVGPPPKESMILLCTSNPYGICCPQMRATIQQYSDGIPGKQYEKKSHLQLRSHLFEETRLKLT